LYGIKFEAIYGFNVKYFVWPTSKTTPRFLLLGHSPMFLAPTNMVAMEGGV
jgi:hypothetical protein